MTINFNKNTIELTTAEMNDAKKYGSEAYKNLMDARRDNPGYRVVEVKAKRTKTALDSIDMKMIKSYVKDHGSEEQKREFLRLTTPTITEDGLYMEAQSFFVVKKWFLAEFPQVKDACQKHIEAVREINDAIDAKIAEAKKQAEKAKNEKAQAEAEKFLKAA